jgi:hypothetical protein
MLILKLITNILFEIEIFNSLTKFHAGYTITSLGRGRPQFYIKNIRPEYFRKKFYPVVI